MKDALIEPMNKTPKRELLTEDDGAKLRFHRGLQCFVRSAHYDFATRAGELDLARSNCTDMRGAIAFFEAIDPDVQSVWTTAAGRPDTVYIRTLGKWEARER